MYSSLMANGFSPHLTDAQQEDYDERAAIIEFDGGLSRLEAEQLAWQIIHRELLGYWGMALEI